jgi:hypothetical protein
MVPMGELRDLPEDVQPAPDASAGRPSVPTHPVTANDLRWFASTFSDLTNPDVVARAWWLDVI